MSRPWKATLRPAAPSPRLCSASQSTNARTSVLRHIQVGKRWNAGSASATGGSWRTWRSMRAASGQSPSIATARKPRRRMSWRVISARRR